MLIGFASCEEVGLGRFAARSVDEETSVEGSTLC